MNRNTIYWLLPAILLIGLTVFIYFTFIKDKVMQKINPSGAKILFVGDSLTAYNQSYADQIKSRFPSLEIKKIAEVGKQTGWMLNALINELSSGVNYDAIVIWGGVNDIYATGSIANAKINLQKMYELASSNEAKVIALDIIPTATYPASNDNANKLTRELNQWIKSNKKIAIEIDVYDIVGNGEGGTVSQYLQSDKLHLTTPAHALIADNFSNRVLKN